MTSSESTVEETPAIPAAVPVETRSSATGKFLFLGLGMAAGAGLALTVYRRPLESVLMAQRAKLWALGIRSQEITTAGSPVTYWSGGDWSSIAIVLVHDPFTASESWHRLLPRISKTFRVLAPDLPGFGRSPDPVDASAAHLAKVLGSLLLDEGLESAILVGSSLGGLVAIETALRYPNLVRGLVLEDVMGVTGDLPEPSLLLHETRADVDELIRKLYYEAPPIPAFVREEMVFRSQRPNLRALLKNVSENGRQLEKLLSQLQVPTLVVWGDADGLCPIEQGEHLNRQIPGSRFVRLPSCGHLPHRERPEAFYEELMDFLAGPTPELRDNYEI